MNLTILQSSNPKRVHAYVVKKFKKFNGVFYPKAKRTRKAAEYWLAAQGSRHGQQAIEDAYQEVFKQLFPFEVAERIEEERARQPVKIESGEWLEQQQRRLSQAGRTKTLLQQWKDEGEYQMGEDFFLRLQQEVAFLEEDDLCDPARLLTEFEAYRVQKLTATHEVGPGSFHAEFDAMLGYEQHAAMRFECYDPKWGELTGKIEELFKAGVWTGGSAKAEMTRLGFSAELQAAIAIGAQLNIDGECTWKKGAAGLTLAGDCELFAGARGDLRFKLSANALKGIDACLKAGGFAGVSATVSGSCAFTYEGEKLVGLNASAGVSFGAGATCEISLKAPIFGPTEFKFAWEAALGLGTTTSTAVAINFTGIYLAGKNEFTKVVYLPTLARGYKMDLMTQDAKNLHYLKKCITRVGDEEEELGERIRSFEKMPMEKRPLLM